MKTLLAGLLLGTLIAQQPKEIVYVPITSFTRASVDSLVPTPPPQKKETRQVPRDVRPPSRLVSTAYCLTGVMANGEGVHLGAVAMNGVPFGAKYQVLSGPLKGRTFTVKDRIGHGSQFDIWMASCQEALSYGRRTIQVRRVK